MNDPQDDIQPTQIDTDNESNPELEKSIPEKVDSQDYAGHEEDPEFVQEKTTTDRAEDLGITTGDEEHPQELNSQDYIARTILS